MRTLRYLSLLGLFAAVGAALAIGLAVSTSSPLPLPAATWSQTASVPVASPNTSSATVAETAKRPATDKPASAASDPGGWKAAKRADKPDAWAPGNRPSKATLLSLGKELKWAAPNEPLEAPLPPEIQAAKPSPPVAQQVPAAPTAPQVPPLPGKDTRDALQKIYKSLVGPLTAGPPAAPPEAVPAAPGAQANAKAQAAVPPPPAPTIEPDKKAAEGDGRLRIQFPETEIRDVLDSLAEYANLNILTSRSVQGKISVRLRNVDVNEALDAIVRQGGYASRREGNFVYVGVPQELDAMQQTFGQIKTRVYRPNYVSSTELETLIRPMLSEKLGVITKFEAPKGQSSSGSGGGGGNGGSSSGGASGDFEGRDGYAGTEVIVVRDYEAVLAQVDEIVAEVDARPMQVAIEAMILSVKMNDTDKLGINFQFLQQKHPELVFNVGQPAQFQGTGALSIAFTDSHLGAFLDALQETNDTNVIATPRLMVLNKQRAEIHIGREQGYISSTTQTETATTATMQMLQTGTLLRLRPYLSSDGLIRMDVHPELSSGEVIEKANTLVPDKEITQVTTNIMVRDGCTVIIGGLMREQLTKNQQRIAFLGGLPLVGALFRNTVETAERQEILVLITPHIVYEPESCREGEAGACEFHRRQAVVAEKMCSLGTRHLGRRYLRLAQNAWAAGDRDTALRYVELAVHFDPENRAAIDLRANIWQNQPCGKFSLCPAPCADPKALDGPEIAGWLMDDLEHGTQVQPAPKHPLDPGRPGTRRDIERPRSLP
jgi:type IV pilus assembly protein PilQ